MNQEPAGTGYFISPTGTAGPGVLFLHSLWGLNRDAKDSANRLSDAGFTVLAPDLADGEVFASSEDALEALQRADVNVLASLVQSSASIVSKAQLDPSRPIGVIGFGPGASWALWLSARLGSLIGPVVTYYGSQDCTLERSEADYLCHWAAVDAYVTDAEVANLGLSMQMAHRPFRFEHHANTESGFAEASRPEYNAAAAAIAWRQTLEFLASSLRPHDAATDRDFPAS